MRLIDADAIDTRYSDPEVVETLEGAPTIDAVPVVRCRECKHWSEHPEGYLGVCSFISRNFVMKNGYCAWGERKEEEQDNG